MLPLSYKLFLYSLLCSQEVLTLYRHPAGLLFFSQFLTVFVRRHRWLPELSGSPWCPWCGWILMGLVPLLMAVRLSPVGLFSPPVSSVFLVGQILSSSFLP